MISDLIVIVLYWEKENSSEDIIKVFVTTSNLIKKDAPITGAHLLQMIIYYWNLIPIPNCQTWLR